MPKSKYKPNPKPIVVTKADEVASIKRAWFNDIVGSIVNGVAYADPIDLKRYRENQALLKSTAANQEN